MKHLIMQLSKPPVTSFLLGPNIFLSGVLKHPQVFNVIDQVSHPYRTTGKIIVLCNNFMFLDSKHEDKRLWTE
jgi:hypothetical protein